MFPVISAHFIGMFGLVLFVGSIIDWVGRTLPLLGGLTLLGVSILTVVLAVQSVFLTSLALFGVGLGWSFSFVAATAELVDLTSPSEGARSWVSTICSPVCSQPHERSSVGVPWQASGS